MAPTTLLAPEVLLALCWAYYECRERCDHGYSKHFDHGYSNNCDHGYSKQPERTIATMITAENPRYRDLLTLFKELSLLLSMPMLL